MGILRAKARNKVVLPLAVDIVRFDGKKPTVAMTTNTGKILMLNINRRPVALNHELICSEELANVCKPYGTVLGVTSSLDGYVDSIAEQHSQVAGLEVSEITYSNFIGKAAGKSKIYIPANHFNVKE